MFRKFLHFSVCRSTLGNRWSVPTSYDRREDIVASYPTITRPAPWDSPRFNTVADWYRPGISTNWDFAASLVGEESEGREKTRSKTQRRAWVPTWYDAIMRYGATFSWTGEGGRTRGKEEEDNERKGGRSEKKEEARKRGGQGGWGLPHWPWLGPKLRWVEVLPGPPVHLLRFSISLFRSALFPSLSLRSEEDTPVSPHYGRPHRAWPCSSAFADSSIKDITKSTLDENTLPLYRGKHRERGENENATSAW